MHHKTSIRALFLVFVGIASGSLWASSSFAVCISTAPALSDAKVAFAKNCPNQRRADCREVLDKWVCANEVLTTQEIEGYLVKNSSLIKVPLTLDLDFLGKKSNVMRPVPNAFYLEREIGVLAKAMLGKTPDGTAGGYLLNLGKGSASFYDPRQSMENSARNSNRITAFDPGMKVAALTLYGGGGKGAKNNSIYVTWGDLQYGWIDRRDNIDHPLFSLPKDKAIIRKMARGGLSRSEGGEVRFAQGWNDNGIRMADVKDYSAFTYKWKQNTSRMYTGRNARIVALDDAEGKSLVQFTFNGFPSYFKWYHSHLVLPLEELKSSLMTRELFVKLIWLFIFLYAVLCSVLIATKRGKEYLGMYADLFFLYGIRTLFMWFIVIASLGSVFYAVSRLQSQATSFNIEGYFGLIEYEGFPLIPVLMTIPFFLFIPTVLYTVKIFVQARIELLAIRKNTTFTTDADVASRQHKNIENAIFDERELPRGMESRALLRKMEEIKERLVAQEEAANAFNRTAKAQHEAHVRKKHAEREADV